MIFFNEIVTVQASRNYSEVLIQFWEEENKIREVFEPNYLKSMWPPYTPPTSLH